MTRSCCSIAASLFSLLVLAFTPISHAQVSGVANFPNVYTWSGNTSTVTVPVNDTQWIRGFFSGSASISTAAGTVSSGLSSYFLNGEGAELQLPVSLLSNGASGSVSGTLSVPLTCSSDCTQSSLTVTVNLSGQSIVASATASPKYYITSILYDPPGDKSNGGFSNTVSAGTSTSISQNFENDASISFTSGFLGADNTVTFGTGVTYGNASSFTTTYQATSGDQLYSSKQAIDHTQDQFFLLVDPTFTLQLTGPKSANYNIGPSVDATGNFGPQGTPPDIINVNIAGLQNPSSIPLQYLQPQVVAPGTTLPGLSFVCANQLPANQCTQQNACGCTSADFSGIVAQDEMANVTDPTLAPSSVDSARFVYLTNAALEGPQNGSGTVTKTYSISDSIINGYSTSNGTSYSVGYSHGWKHTGLFDLNITATDTFKYSQSQTAGTTNGQSHSASVTLGSDKPGCFEYVDVYEDTTYHTFAYSLPQAPPANCQ